MKMKNIYVRFARKKDRPTDWFECRNTDGSYIGRVDYSKDDGWEYLGDEGYCSADCLENIVAFLRQLEDE